MLARTHRFGNRRRLSIILTLAVALAVALGGLASAMLTGLHSPPPTATATAPPASPKVDLGKLPMQFEPNVGQTDPSVRFMSHAPGGRLFFTPSEVVLSLQAGTGDQASQDGKGYALADARPSAPGPRVDAQSNSTQRSQSVVRLRFVGADPAARMSSDAPLPGKVNYMLGNDPTKWHTDVPTYEGVTYSDLYPGVDLAYEGTGNSLKGTYTIAPHSDPTSIRWLYDGATDVSVDSAGNLLIKAQASASNASDSALTLTEQAPVAWQEINGQRVAVDARYDVASQATNDSSIGFTLGAYDPSQPLIIDPQVVISTYLGGIKSDFGRGIAVDSDGNAYITGQTESADFPRTVGPTIIGGGKDAFVTKLNPGLNTAIYSTYLGGGGDDIGYGIALANKGISGVEAYVTGGTASANFPFTTGAFRTANAGSNDAFVTRLSSTGALAYSTYLGGTNFDTAYAIAADSAGYAYISGYTYSTDFPFTTGAFRTANAGGSDAFVTKLNPNAVVPVNSQLVYSTYLGGSGNELSLNPQFSGGTGIAIAAGTNGIEVYVTGNTASPNFPTFPTNGPSQAFQTTNAGNIDAFVTKLIPDTNVVPASSQLVYSTYLGGTNLDNALGIAALGGYAYLTGHTQSADFPTSSNTPGFTFPPYNANYGGSIDIFVTKLNTAPNVLHARQLVYSTYLGSSSGNGGTGKDYGYGITVDPCGYVYVTGPTSSADFPKRDPIQSVYGSGGHDAFVAKLYPDSPGGDLSLIYSTFLGGNGEDQGMGIALNGSDHAYVTGITSSSNFPFPASPRFREPQGSYDGFVAKISDPSDLCQLCGCVEPPVNMVAWYPLDETSGTTMTDRTGTYNGTYYNSPTIKLGQYVLNSRQFDAVNSQYGQSPTGPNFITSTNFTIDAWIKVPTTTTGLRSIVDKRFLVSPPLAFRVGYQMFIQNGLLGVEIADNSGWTDYAMTGPALNDGQWHFVSAVVQRDTTHPYLVTLWAGDTASIPASQTFTNGPRTGSLVNSAPLRLARNSIDTTYLTATLDEVEIFNRALPGTELDAIRKAGAEGKCKTTPTPTPQPCTCPMDVAFVLDTSGTMEEPLRRLQDTTAFGPNLTNLLNTISTASGSDYHLALVTFKDDISIWGASSPWRTGAAGLTSIRNEINSLDEGHGCLNGSASTSNCTGEASDEALNTVFNSLCFNCTVYSYPNKRINIPGLNDGYRCPNPTYLQHGAASGPFPCSPASANFPTWRPGVKRVVIFATNGQPGEFDDRYPGSLSNLPGDLANPAHPVSAANHDIQVIGIGVNANGDPEAVNAAIFTKNYATSSAGLYIGANFKGEPVNTSAGTTVFAQVQTFINRLCSGQQPTTTLTNTFADVDGNAGHPFYMPIRTLSDHGYMGGYPCGGQGEPCIPSDNLPYFRPFANITRGEAVKVVASAAGYTDNISTARQTFADVPPSNPFWIYIERAYKHGVIDGYTCGASGEPCPGLYFRPNLNITRGDLSKIVSTAAGLTDQPTDQVFADIPSSNPFYVWIMRLYLHNAVNTGPCDTSAAACKSPQQQPYFGPNTPAKRGETALFIANSFFPDNPPTPTPTLTPTPVPTDTPTNTPTDTLTPTTTNTSTPVPPCGSGSNYVIATGTATIVPGVTNIGSSCDDCNIAISLPFTYNLYAQPFTSVNVGSNGKLEFSSNNEPGGYLNDCLPDEAYNNVIFPLWDDLMTNTGLTGCTAYASGCGVFTTIEGSAPNRMFDIEWRAVYYENNANIANFEVRLYESQNRFDMIYATLTGGGGPHDNDTGATIGVQNGSGPQNTQFSCDTTSITNGRLLTFTEPPCNTSTPTNTPTNTPTRTNTPTITSTPTRTNTPTSTFTRTPCPSCTNTPTSTFTRTSTSTNTSTRTNTPIPTNTPTP